MMIVTIHVDDNYLGQVLESAEVRADELALESPKDAAFIRKAIAHVEAARERAWGRSKAKS